MLKNPSPSDYQLFIIIIIINYKNELFYIIMSIHLILMCTFSMKILKNLSNLKLA